LKRMSFNDTSFIGTLAAFTRPYRKRLAFGLTAAALASAFDVLGPMLLRSGVNALQASRPVGWLYGFAGSIIIVAFIGGVFRYLMRRVVIGASRWVESDLRENYFSHLLSLAPKFFDRSLTGDLMARSTDDLERVRMVLGPALQFSVATSLTLIFSAAMMFYLDPKLALLVMILAPVIGGVVISLTGTIHRVNLQQQRVYGALEAHVQENLSGARVIKSFVREQRESEKFAATCRLYFKRSMVVARVQALFMPVLTMLIGFGVAGIMWVGGQRVIAGVIGLGDFIAFLSYLALMTWPMIALGWVTHLYQRGKASHKRLREILDVNEQFSDDDGSADGHEADDKTVQPASEAQASGIRFSNIRFSYNDQGPQVFDNLNLLFPQGKITAVVGRTGSGKSTLLRILSRLYEPRQGTVILSGFPELAPPARLEAGRTASRESRSAADGREVAWNELPVSRLRRMIGYVDQTPFLFSATITENIAFGKPDATVQEIRHAAQMARFDLDVDDFPDAYDTRIGERGVTLSGGQQQRLTLARALLLDPPILVLDDALSAVDTRTESEIINNIKTGLKGKTVILVTHRLAASERADRIAVLEGGAVAEFGTHEELMKLGGVYADMYHRQRLADELGEIS